MTMPISVATIIMLWLFAFFATPTANAQTSGKCGDNLFWNYNSSTKTLTISGTGDMYDYYWDYGYGTTNTPWYYNSNTILVLQEGITRIGNYAFCDCSGITGSITIPNSMSFN
jgi:hypothetical protein